MMQIAKKRVVIVSCSIFFLFSLLIAQYFRIQIIEGDTWEKRALSQHEFTVKVPARRGTFYSNTSIKKVHTEKEPSFALDITKYHLFADPKAIPLKYHLEVATLVGKSLKMAPEVIFPELQKKSRSRKLAMWLPKESKETIHKWWFDYAKKRKIPANALYFVADYKRSYPFGKMLGQVLHTIRDLKDEATHAGVPTGGLEAIFNDVLKGKEGKQILLRSPLNSLENDKVIEKPLHGADIYLTVNHCLQAIAEEEIEKGVKRAKAKGGWAVMMDPHTGEILAFAQYPFFDPARYKEFFNDKEKIEISKVKPLTDAFELGSIMKPITVATCLKANEGLKTPILLPTEKVDTSRALFPGRGNKPLKDNTFHHYLNMYMAIQKSSNVYMAVAIDKAVQTRGNEWYRNTLVNTFGFGKKTGIELPGEATGLIPTPGKLHPNGALEWSVPTPYSLAMGHNMMATSIQMLRAYAVFANGGKLVEPTLIRKIVRKNQEGKEEVLLDNTTEERVKHFPQVLSPEICFEVLKAMKYTTKTGGTASRAAISGYSEAGKTGTAEKIVDGSYCKKRHISSFIGIAPADLSGKNPCRFVLLITIDDPEYRILEGGTKTHLGGWCAAPIFGEIGKRTLEYLGVDPDDPSGYPNGDPRYDAQTADWVKEIQDLKTLYDSWNKR